MKYLIISEKQNAAQRIAYILSNGDYSRVYIDRVPVMRFGIGHDQYSVIGLRGHILELDYPDEYNSWENVDLKDLVWAKPIKRNTAADIASCLEKLARECDTVVIATDFDREGELIGVEALEIVLNSNDHPKIKRARFSALTKYEIEKAFSNLVDVDYNLAKAAESRQMIDLAWGAVITRFLSLASGKVGRDFISAGRVQSPTLSIIVDREKEIESFVPEPYWNIVADCTKNDQTFQAEHNHGIFRAGERAEAERVYKSIKNCRNGIIQKIEKNESRERPPPPFNTTMFLTEATRLGFSAQNAMKIAEDLYTRGYISYPRTDNTVYPRSLNLNVILERLTKSEFSKEASELMSQKEIKPSRGKMETTDHPPIYPTDAAKKSDLKGDQWKIYELVARRFMATVAPDCVAGTTKLDLTIGNEPFKSCGYIVIEPGWRKYYPYWRVNETRIPELKQGDLVDVRKMALDEKHTTPPQRYTQGSLLQEMEKHGLGTKSTRHEIIQKLYDRKYVTGRTITPTLPGRAVTESLEKYAQTITEPEMTAGLEREMDAIATGEKLFEDVVKDSQDILIGIVGVLQKNKDRIGREISDALREHNHIGKCGRCGGSLHVRTTKTGGRFIGCTNYPDCDNTYPLPATGMITATGEACGHCNVPMIQVHRREIGTEKVCLNPECPETKRARHIGKCPDCGGDLRIIHSSRGKRFVGCSSYPKCRNTYPLPQTGKVLFTNGTCAACKAPIVKMIMKGNRTWTLCINMDCPGKQRSANENRKSGKVAKTGTRAKDKKDANDSNKKVAADAKKKGKVSSMTGGKRTGSTAASETPFVERK